MCVRSKNIFENAMSYFIIIRGPLGVGKSTIAKKLADILDANYIAIDDVLAKHGLDKIDPKIGCISSENFIKADEIILPEIKNQLENGKIIIFDACFYHKEHIEHLIQNLLHPNYVFTLKAPLKICIERDSKRQKGHGKDAATAVHNLVSKFDYGVVINTEDKTANQVIEEINSYLKND